jgi:hypothetical protein
MSTRPHIAPMVVLNAGSMAGNLTTLPTIIQKLSMISYAFVWSGTAPVGTVSVQVSNDYSVYPTGQVNNPGTWNTIVLNVGGTPSSTIPVTGATGNGFIDIDQMAAYAIRAIYTATSGTGSLTVILNSKVA